MRCCFLIVVINISNKEAMGCCASSDEGAQPGDTNTSKPATAAETATSPALKSAPSNSTPSATSASAPAPASAASTTEPMSTGGGGGQASDGGQASYVPKEVKGAKAFLPATAQVTNSDVSQPAAVPTSKSSGPKAVRGWAPPAKEWDKETKSKGDQTRFEIKEEWDEDGNLVRTTIKKTITPDWKTKIERTTEVIPAAQAAKEGKKKP